MAQWENKAQVRVLTIEKKKQVAPVRLKAWNAYLNIQKLYF
jgi:hypothetical protein